MVRVKVKVIYRVAIGSVVGLVLFLILKPEPTQVIIPDDIRVENYDLFEEILNEDFPRMDGEGHLQIPRIIHQTWKSTTIPSRFIDNINSYVTKNVGWRYYFWTDNGARQLIKERHPSLIPIWDTYTEGIRRSDVLRYVVLYEFGGIYADLDSVCLRPLDRVITKYSCIFPPEPYEHATLIYQAEYMLTNAVMLCRRKHPFLKQLLDKLPSHAHMAATVDSTGPAFVTSQYMDYNGMILQDLLPSLQSREQDHARQKIRLPSFTVGRRNHSPEDSVYVPNSQYFQYRIDRMMYGVFYDRCTKYFHTLPYVSKRGCVHLFTRGGMARSVSKYAFTDHMWYHSYYKYFLLEWMFSRDILDIVPHAIV